MKLPCAVVRDLLPLYVEKILEPETAELVEAHLKDCLDCQQRLPTLRIEEKKNIDTSEPLRLLKKQIQKRRWNTSLIVSLCVFVAVYIFFYHVNKRFSVFLDNGQIEVKGIETLSVGELLDFDTDMEVTCIETPNEDEESMVEVLILRCDSRFNETYGTNTKEDDGTTTFILRLRSSRQFTPGILRDYREMAIYPVPDRLIYDDGSQQRQIWGKPQAESSAILPCLGLLYYMLIAASMALLSGLLWLFLRNRDYSRIIRQIFFASTAYILSHFLIKGTHSVSFFIEYDLLSILLIAAAIYALMTLIWKRFCKLPE